MDSTLDYSYGKIKCTNCGMEFKGFTYYFNLLIGKLHMNHCTTSPRIFHEKAILVHNCWGPKAEL